MTRRHGIVLARPLARACALSVGGMLAVAVGWPVTPVGALALVVGALLGLRSVWQWERTRIVVTAEELAVHDGTVRRRSAAVPLARLGAVELEQSLLGRVLGYGTVVAGELEIPYVARPRELVAVLR